MTDPAPPTHPLANVMTDGFRTPLQRFPENNELVLERREAALRALSPRNALHAWFTDDIALMTVRLDRVARVERRERDRVALRAEFHWDEDRRLQANELGDRLASNPPRVVPKLRATPQGCDWLIEQWGWLRGVTDAGLPWDEGQTALALDLLGTPHRFRTSPATLARLADPAGLIRAEVAALEAQKASVAEADGLDRALAMADMVEPSTPEYRSLKRYEAGIHRRMRWSMEQLDLMPRFAEPHPELVERRAAAVAAMHQPAVADGPVLVDPPTWLEPPPPPEPPAPPTPKPQPRTSTATKAPAEPAVAPTRSQRPDPATLRARTRRATAARQRREDRPSL